MFLRNRYYDPNAGQFSQGDPIGQAGGANLYGYAGNKRLSYSDPYGLCPTCENEATLKIQVERVESFKNAGAGEIAGHFAIGGAAVLGGFGIVAGTATLAQGATIAAAASKIPFPEFQK